MDFYTVLDQVVALLRRRGRVSYRALKRQFALDDELLTDLKAELRYAHYPIEEDHDQGLVWTGETAPPSEQTPPPPRPETEHAPHAAQPPAEPRTPDAERRQLTVLFCDLVDSTALASQLDPEDWREMLWAYQDTCAKVIQRFDGHIAQYLGDGLLVYFGYPQAHEDDAQRAVRVGLGIAEAMGQLNMRLTRERGVSLGVRLGMHTGLVVVGDVGGGNRQEQLALGETSNLAARLQGMATPNTLVVSAATVPLLGGFFTCQLSYSSTSLTFLNAWVYRRTSLTLRLGLGDGVWIACDSTPVMHEGEPPQARGDGAFDILMDQGRVHHKALAEEAHTPLVIREADEREAPVSPGQALPVQLKPRGKLLACARAMDLPGRPLPELGIPMLGIMEGLKVSEFLADMRQMAKLLRPPE
jgi:class 3 adenylate cyclase